jgi:hypothetical protein
MTVLSQATKRVMIYFKIQFTSRPEIAPPEIRGFLVGLSQQICIHYRQFGMYSNS